jgi:hypothetical protein
MKSASVMRATVSGLTIIVAVIVTRAFGQTPPEKDFAEGTDWGGKHSFHSRKAAEGVRSPSASEPRRLCAEWGRVGAGRWEDGGLFRKGRQSPWQETKEVERDGLLGIRGKLLIESEDGNSLRPLLRPQPIRVVIARSPGTRPDWRKRHSLKYVTSSSHGDDFAWSDCIAASDGTFLAAFKPDDLRRTPGTVSEFHVAVALGKREGETVTWDNSTVILPRSTGVVPIPGPRVLSKTLQAINGAPLPEPEDYDPAMLIRAVNHLHALGKERAIAEMREFLKVATPRFWEINECDPADRDPANIDTSDSQCILLIAPLLFEPAEPGVHMPDIVPIVVKDDVPFLTTGRRPRGGGVGGGSGGSFAGVVGGFGGLWGGSVTGVPWTSQQVGGFAGGSGFGGGGGWGGNAPSGTSQLDWAARHGKLRAKPLRPTGNPLDAAATLLAKPPFRYSPMPLRQEAWNAISHLVKLKSAPRLYPWSDADWEECKKEAARLKIHWSEEQQQYVAGNTTGPP